MNISCIITDDEPVARKGLETYVQKIPFLQLAAVCEDAMQLNDFLQQQKVDLLFLDIEMPYLSGIQLLKTLKDPPRVIFTTAYENYALQGFELDVLDYLLKPVSFERFLKAANKAADYFASRQQPAADYFFIKADGRMEKIFFRDIISVEARENYVAIHTALKKCITHATLKSVQAMLPGHFLQPHKSWLVNSEQVTAVEGNIIYCSAQQIPLSKYQKEEVLQKILNGKLLRRGVRLLNQINVHRIVHYLCFLQTCLDLLLNDSTHGNSSNKEGRPQKERHIQKIIQKRSRKACFAGPQGPVQNLQRVQRI